MRAGIFTLSAAIGLATSATSIGCANMNRAQPGAVPPVRTISSIGDRPLTVVSGEPGSSAVAINDTLPPASTSRTGTITGRVLDDRGDPIPNAAVRVAVSGTNQGRVARSRTDSGGGFTLSGLRPGSDYTVIVESESDEGLRIHRQVVRAPDKQVVFRMDPGDSPVTRVSDRSEERPEVNDRPTSAADIPGRINWEDLPESSRSPSRPSRSQRLDQLNEEFPPTDPPNAPSTRSTQGWRPIGDRTETPSRDDSAILQSSWLGATTPIDQSRDFRGVSRSMELLLASRPLRAIRLGNPPAPSLPPTSTNGIMLASATIEETETPGSLRPARRSTSSTITTVARVPGPPVRHRPTWGEVDRPVVEPSYPSTPEQLVELQRGAQSDTGSQSQSQSAVGPTVPSESSKNEAVPASQGQAPFRMLGGRARTREDSIFSQENAPKLVTSEVEPTTSDRDATEAEQSPRSRSADESTNSGSEPGGLASQRRVAPSVLPLRFWPFSRQAGTTRSICRYDAASFTVRDLRLPDLDGRMVKLRDFDSEYILLDFWGTWCGPCRQSIPTLIDLQKRLGPRKLSILGIAYEEADTTDPVATVRQTARELGINYTLLMGQPRGDCPVLSALKIEAFPTMILLDRQGRVVWREQGASRETLGRLESILNSPVPLGQKLVARP